MATIIVACLVVSWATRPSAKTLANRQTPVTTAVRLGTATRLAAVVVAATVLPFTIQFAQSARSAEVEASRWTDATGDVTLSFSSAIEGTDLDQYRSGLKSFANQVGQQHLAALSFTMDQALDMTGQLGPYDHVVITDPSFLSLMHVANSGPGSDLKEIGPKTLPAPLASTLAAQFKIWTTDKSAAPPGVTYYSYSGKKAFPAIGFSLTGSNTIEARHPLVIVVDNPMQTFTSDGFLLTAMVNGNLVFTNADRVRELLNDTHLDGIVNSIDNVADETLTSAQEYSQQAQLGGAAILMTALAIVVALIQAAQAWASTNQRRIFTLHSSGRGYWSIQARQFAVQLLFILVVCLLSTGLSAAVYQIPFSQIVLVIGLIIPLYLVGAVLTHRAAAQAAFHSALHRRA